MLDGSLSPDLCVHLHFKSLPTPEDKGMAIFLTCEMLPIQARKELCPLRSVRAMSGEPCTRVHTDAALRAQNWVPAGGLCHRPGVTGSAPRPSAFPQAHGYIWARPAFLEGRQNTSGILLETSPMSTSCVLEKPGEVKGWE